MFIISIYHSISIVPLSSFTEVMKSLKTEAMRGRLRDAVLRFPGQDSQGHGCLVPRGSLDVESEDGRVSRWHKPWASNSLTRRRKAEAKAKELKLKLSKLSLKLSFLCFSFLFFLSLKRAACSLAQVLPNFETFLQDPQLEVRMAAIKAAPWHRVCRETFQGLEPPTSSTQADGAAALAACPYEWHEQSESLALPTLSSPTVGPGSCRPLREVFGLGPISLELA